MDTFFLASMIVLWLVVLLNLLLTLALIRRFNHLDPALLTQQKEPPNPLLHTSAPPFTAQTLDHATVTLDNYRHKTTVFVFIGTNCTPCHEILPSLHDYAPMAQLAGTELVIVSGSDYKSTHTLMQDMHLSLPTLIAPQDENPFFANYHVSGTPFYCLINADGIIQSAGYPSSHHGEWKALTDGWITHNTHAIKGGEAAKQAVQNYSSI